jgi:hypothetical protein
MQYLIIVAMLDLGTTLHMQKIALMESGTILTILDAKQSTNSMRIRATIRLLIVCSIIASKGFQMQMGMLGPIQ